MDIKEKVISILREVKPTKDLKSVTGIVEDGYLDSLELINLITALCDTFDIEISAEDISPENFNSVEAIVSMVRLLSAN